eukprot:m.418070 g.418070  ORF g.418070 m.418070 type:complete len:117 (-) comp21288_c0_seq55:42-392(-)
MQVRAYSVFPGSSVMLSSGIFVWGQTQHAIYSCLAEFHLKASVFVRCVPRWENVVRLEGARCEVYLAWSSMSGSALVACWSHGQAHACGWQHTVRTLVLVMFSSCDSAFYYTLLTS